MSIRLAANERFKAAASAAALSGKGLRVTVIEGPSGSGKSLMAAYLASAVLCEDEKTRPCGACRACRLVEAGIHPGVIRPERDKKTVISVDAIKDLRRDAYVRPVMGREKIYLFEEAEALNVEGQNALLKLFEEPPETARFILLVSSRSFLLPTVLSRASLFTAEAVSFEESVAFLREKYPEKDEREIHTAARLAAGVLGQAAASLSDEDGVRGKALSYLKTAARRDEYALFKAGDALARDPDLNPGLFLDALKELLLLSSMDAAGLSYAGEDTAPRFGKEKAAALTGSVNELRRWVDANVAPGPLFTGLSASFSALLETFT
ncbi:MAG: hypothetical protein IKX85_01125 [Clostridia bacterium]|nr:hypothetical protein [Clostridia bacterium]